MTFPFPVTTSQRRIEKKKPAGLKNNPSANVRKQTNNDSSYEKQLQSS
jgi:hypothetical protein